MSIWHDGYMCFHATVDLKGKTATVIRGPEKVVAMLKADVDKS